MLPNLLYVWIRHDLYILVLFLLQAKKNKDHVISHPGNSGVEERDDDDHSDVSPGANGPTLTPIPEKSGNDDSTLRRSYARSASLDNGLQNAHLHITRSIIENDYVPDPQNSPQLSHHKMLMRTYTTGELDHSPVHVVPRENGQEWCVSDLADSPPPMAKHHSLVSMESGYSFGCEEDFNVSLPLINQPWFHSQITQTDAEALLQEDGDFLLRENILMEGTNVLSMMWGDRCHHINVQSAEVVTRSGGNVSTTTKYQLSNGAFDSVPELIFNHLRYQIPIDKEMTGVLTNPVCKIGSRGVSQASYAPDATLKYSSYSTGTLPRPSRPNSASAAANRRSRELLSPDLVGRQSGKASRSSSFSPQSSSRNSPVRDSMVGNRQPNAVLVQAIDLDDEDEQSNLMMGSMYRDTMTPSPDIDVPHHTTRPESNLLHRTTYSSVSSDKRDKTSTSSAGEPGAEDGDDYEVMESVLIRPVVNTSPKVATREPHGQYATLGSHLYQQRQYSSPGLTLPHPNSVKYAEINFSRSRSSTTVVTDPYASPADLARKRNDSVNYVSLRPLNSSSSSRSNYIQVSPASSTHSSPASSTYSSPQKSRKAPTTNYASISSLCFTSPNPASSSSSPSTASRFAHRPVSTVSRATKPPQTIHEIHSFIKDFSTDELAIHLTKADAVCFLLTARPGENEELWQNRCVCVCV